MSHERGLTSLIDGGDLAVRGLADAQQVRAVPDSGGRGIVQRLRKIPQWSRTIRARKHDVGHRYVGLVEPAHQ